MGEREPGVGARPRLLIVEDDSDYRMILGRVVEKVSRAHGWDWDLVASVKEGEERLRGGTVNLVVSDYHLQDGLGTVVLHAAQRNAGHPLRILLTGDAHIVKSRWTDAPGAFDDIWSKDDGLQIVYDNLDASMARAEYLRYWEPGTR